MTGRRCFTCGGAIPAGATPHTDFCSIHCEHYYGLAQASARNTAATHANARDDA
ncbi:MAG: hypothetical protein ACYDCK_05655 [Thermoplasmatota archaeon]